MLTDAQVLRPLNPLAALLVLRPVLAGPDGAELLHEDSGAGAVALLDDVTDPDRIAAPRTLAALAAGDHPMDPAARQPRRQIERPQERLGADEPDCGRGRQQVRQPFLGAVLVLH